MKNIIPYRFKKLALAAQASISAMKMYSKDVDSRQVTLDQTGKDISDLISLSIQDGGFTPEEQRGLISALIEDLKTKFPIKK